MAFLKRGNALINLDALEDIRFEETKITARSKREAGGTVRLFEDVEHPENVEKVFNQIVGFLKDAGLILVLDGVKQKK